MAATRHGSWQHLVGIRSETKQVVGGLHRSKALPGHHYSSGVVKALNGRAHGCFQLEHWRAAGVAGIHCLLVLDQGQLQHTIAGFQLCLQLPKMGRITYMLPEMSFAGM